MDDRLSPSAAGALAEAAVASALVRAGHAVYAPIFSAHSRVDLVYEKDGRFVGVQCKTARSMRNNTLYFRTCSNTGNSPRAYAGAVDEFGVYSLHTGLVYVLPASAMPSRGCSLRLLPTRNGQSAGVRWAKDFELGPP
jgi:hypothetical protein